MPRNKTWERPYITKYPYFIYLKRINCKCDNNKLRTWLTIVSTTCPLNGRNTIALYFTGYVTNPLPGWISPCPIVSIAVTPIMNPCFPVHVPSTCKLNRLIVCNCRLGSLKYRIEILEGEIIIREKITSWKSLAFIVSLRFGPKYFGCKQTSCSKDKWKNI